MHSSYDLNICVCSLALARRHLHTRPRCIQKPCLHRGYAVTEVRKLDGWPEVYRAHDDNVR